MYFSCLAAKFSAMNKWLTVLGLVHSHFLQLENDPLIAFMILWLTISHAWVPVIEFKYYVHQGTTSPACGKYQKANANKALQLDLSYDFIFFCSCLVCSNPGPESLQYTLKPTTRLRRPTKNKQTSIKKLHVHAPTYRRKRY